VRMRSLLRAGCRMIASSAFLIVSFSVAGLLQDWWTQWLIAPLFFGGLADVVIAALFNVSEALRGEGGESCVAVEFDDTGMHCWVGDRAQENRERYLEQREGRQREGARTPAGRRRLAGGVFLGTVGPSGLSYRPPAGDPSRPPEKRLLLSPFLRAQGVSFPDEPAYAGYDRLGRPQPPFPVHFRTLPPVKSADGTRLAPAVMETHSDHHDDCPACDAWKRMRAWRH
jgi:hypothetical protein